MLYPLTTDQWALWPPTPVTLATLSMEAPPGLVGVMECGVDRIQRVKVGGNTFTVMHSVLSNINISSIITSCFHLRVYSHRVFSSTDHYQWH